MSANTKSNRGVNEPIEAARNSILSNQKFYILLALSAEKATHGYAIKQRVIEDSAGEVVLSTATLYGALKKLTAMRLIQEVHKAPQLTRGKDRRYYEITALGRRTLDFERQRLERAVVICRQRLLGPTAWSVK